MVKINKKKVNDEYIVVRFKRIVIYVTNDIKSFNIIEKCFRLYFY